MDHVVQIIQNSLRNKYTRSTGNSTFISCPYHKNDDTPSLGINLDTQNGIPLGFFHCFGCGEKGSWNKLAETLGLRKIEGFEAKRQEVGGEEFDQVREELFSVTHVQQIYKELDASFHLDWPSDKIWRHIPPKLLGKVGAQITYDKHNSDIAILLPVSINNEVKGVIKGTNRKQTNSYIMNEGRWLKTWGLYPFDYTISLAREKEYVVLVEGARDALRLLHHGIPALAILGSQNWSMMKRNLVLSMNVKGVVLAFDGDRAGVACTNKVYRDLKGMIRMRVLKLKEESEKQNKKVDPGNMSRDLLCKVAKLGQF